MDSITQRYQRITAVYALFALASVLTYPVFSIYLTNKGIDAIWIGILLSSFSLAAILFSPLVGGISDTIGRKPVILVSIFLQAFAILLYVTVQNPLIVFIARILDAIGYFGVVLVAIAKMEDLLSDSPHKAEAVGRSLSIGQLGHVAGPLIGGLLADVFFVEMPFYASVLLLGLLLIWYALIPRTAPPKPPFKKLTFNPFPAMKKVLVQPALRGLALLGMAHQSVVPVFFVFLPLYITQTFHLSFFHVGIALFAQALPMMFQFYGGKLSDQMGSRKIIFIGSVITCISLVALAFAPSFEWLIVGLVIHGIGTSLWNVAGLSFLSTYGEKTKQEATYLGSFISMAKIGAFVSFIVSGIIAQLFGMTGLFLGVGFMIALAMAYDLGVESVRRKVVEVPMHFIHALFHWR